MQSRGRPIGHLHLLVEIPEPGLAIISWLVFRVTLADISVLSPDGGVLSHLYLLASDKGPPQISRDIRRLICYLKSLFHFYFRLALNTPDRRMFSLFIVAF